jgi:hypothetical protein
MEEYPIVLTYSYPGNVVTVRCDNKEQADRAFEEMFCRPKPLRYAWTKCKTAQAKL